MDVVLMQALHLHSLGIATLFLYPRSKVPVGKGWQKQPFPTEQTIRRSYRPGFNLGIRTGRVSGAVRPLVAVDLDSDEALRWALANLPIPLMRTKTRSGEHWFYLAPQSAVSNRAHIGIDGRVLAIDLRGEGGQVVCAPSVHPTGFQYLQLGHWDAWGVTKLVTFDPSWFPTYRTEAPQVSKPFFCAADRPWRRAVGFLRRVVGKGELPERGSGQGTKVFSLARILLSEFGLSEGEAFLALQREYNPYSPQPYDEESLRRKVREAATKGRATHHRYGGAK